MLGMVATGKRRIKNGDAYNQFFSSRVDGKETVIMKEETVHDTVRNMKKIVRETLPQTKAISAELKGSTLAETCRNIWQFLYDHIQYKTDHSEREQVREPARSWRDRTSGIDCDCYSVFISSILTNLKIPHCIRMAGYKGDFQHVYVVVPKDGKNCDDTSSYFTIDPVVNRFDYEVKFTKKDDSKMLTRLSGTDNAMNNGGCPTKPQIERLQHFADTDWIIQRGGIPTTQFLDANGIDYAPSYDNDSNRAIYIVQTPDGLLALPSILDKAQAEKVKTQVGPCAINQTPVATTPAASSPPIVSPQTVDAIKEGAKKNWIWLVLIAAGTLVLFTGSDQSEVQTGLSGTQQQQNTPGLGGLNKPKGKRRMRTMSM